MDKTALDETYRGARAVVEELNRVMQTVFVIQSHVIHLRNRLEDELFKELEEGVRK